MFRKTSCGYPNTIKTKNKKQTSKLTNKQTNKHVDKQIQTNKQINNFVNWKYISLIKLDLHETLRKTFCGYLKMTQANKQTNNFWVDNILVKSSHINMKLSGKPPEGITRWFWKKTANKQKNKQSILWINNIFTNLSGKLPMLKLLGLLMTTSQGVLRAMSGGQRPEALWRS